MIKALEKENVKDAVAAGHYSIQVMRQWKFALETLYKAFAEDSTLTAEQAQLVKRIIKEIEKKENIQISQLSRDKVEEYIKSLSDTISKLSQNQLKVNLQQGRVLLNKLRSQI